MKTTCLTAHSGCDGTPDNAMEFVRYALTLPVDCLEVDVRRGRKGLILAHDESGTGAPLEEALFALAAHPKMKINLDLKEPGLEEAVYTCAAKCGVADRLIYSGTVKKCAATEKVDWYLNIELLSPTGTATLAQIEAGMGETGARCLNAHYSIADTPLYAALRAKGIPLSLWTPSEDDLLRRFLADGVYNITTRAARRACEIRANLRLAETI